MKVLEGHNDYVNSIVYTPDSSTLYSASSDMTIKCWNVYGGAEVFDS